MGDWTKFEFGRDVVPKRCYLFAGDVPEDRKNSILSCYEQIEFHKHTVYERYIVSDGLTEDLLLFQVYGASTICDLAYILKDAGVEDIIFIGTAFGVQTGLEVGDYVIPTCVQSLDGLLKTVFDVEYAKPNELMLQRIIDKLRQHNVSYDTGKSVSVPCTFYHPPKENFDTDIVALEMEYATICYVSELLGMNCAGVLIISDTQDHSLLDDRTLLYENWLKLFKLLASK